MATNHPPPPAVVYFSQVGGLFCSENGKFGSILANFGCLVANLHTFTGRWCPNIYKCQVWLCLPPAAMVATKDIEPLLIIVGKFDNPTGVVSSVPSQVPSTVPSVCWLLFVEIKYYHLMNAIGPNENLIITNFAPVMSLILISSSLNSSPQDPNPPCFFISHHTVMVDKMWVGGNISPLVGVFVVSFHRICCQVTRTGNYFYPPHCIGLLAQSYHLVVLVMREVHRVGAYPVRRLIIHVQSFTIP